MAKENRVVFFNITVIMVFIISTQSGGFDTDYLGCF
jgi:hypothetical protein